MISPAALERPGHWRTIGVIAGVLIVSSPALPLLQLAFDGSRGFDIGAGFDTYLARSFKVGIGASALALVLGFPCGLIAGLYRFPSQNVLLALLALPLLVPSFLWAIGLSMLRIELGLSPESLLSGALGTVMAFAALGTGLVLFATLLATRALAARAIDAARLAGGELNVLRYAGRATLPAGAAACLLAGLISFADPGPGQILGYSGAGTQILVSFAALFDFELAARQSLAITGIVLLGAMPLLWILGRHLSYALLPQSMELMRPRSHAAVSGSGPFLLGLVLMITLALPLAGLVWPAFTQLWLERIAEVAARTAGNTLFYGITAGVVATAVAIPMVICATRTPRLRLALLVALMLVFVLPPAVGALGAILVASAAPAWLDPVVRSRFTVAVVLGLRLTPIAAIILLRAMGAAPPSWAFSAAIHGVGLMTYLRKLLMPFLARPVAVSIVLVGLVATADTTTVLLLQPPGRDSFPVAVFTVMANAPESMVASLSLAYVVAGALAASALAIWFNTERSGSGR